MIPTFWRGQPRMARISLLVLVFITAAVCCAPMITHYDPITVDLTAVYQHPTAGHVMGTDALGRDILTRLLFGGRISLLVGITSIIVSTLVGSGYGALSGLLGGAADSLMMRVVDALLALPSMMLMLVIQTITGGGIVSLIMVIGFTGWMQTARMVRAEVLSLRERDFVKAAGILGTPWWRIIFRHLLPHCLPTITVVTTLGVGHAIISEATLSFLGLGIPSHIPSWGNMLMGGQNSILAGAWWMDLFPGVAIVATVLSFIYVGDYLQLVFNPRRPVTVGSLGGGEDVWR